MSVALTAIAVTTACSNVLGIKDYTIEDTGTTTGSSLLADGEACTAGAQCLHGACAGDTCCATECPVATCLACRVELTGVPTGECGLVMMGLDPYMQCTASPNHAGDGGGACY